VTASTSGVSSTAGEAAQTSAGELAGAVPVADLVGTWLLVDFARLVDGEVVSHPMGESPRGQLSYQVDGRMSAVLMARERTWDPGEVFLETSDESRGRAALGFVGYAGTYEVSGDRVIHHVEFSLYPDHVGTDLVRLSSRRGEALVLCAEERRTRSGRSLVDRFEWTPA
jgi:hypothetical protein